MQEPGASDSRPVTPEFLFTGSLSQDELTAALANFSRVPSPDFPAGFACCCRRDDCEKAKAWLTLKGKLESRLILSAGTSYCPYMRAPIHSLSRLRGRTSFTEET